METRPPIFKILALGPFCPSVCDASLKAPLKVDRADLDGAMQQMDIRWFFPLDPHLCPAGGLNLRFDSFKALHPDAWIKSNTYLSHLNDAQQAIREAQRKGQDPSQIASLLTKWPDLPPMKLPAAPAAGRQGTRQGALDQLLDMVALPGQGEQPNELPAEPRQTDLLRTIVESLLRDPGFRRMEAAWRGLRLMLQQGLSAENVVVEIDAIHPDTLEAKFERLATHIAADPPGLLLVDLPIDNSPLCMAQLDFMSRWADALMIPVAAWVSPAFFQLGAWNQIDRLPFLPNHLDTAEYAKFRKIRTAPQGRWLCLCCNRFLVRYPYGENNPAKQVTVKENDPLWISPVWGLGTLVAQAVCGSGWPTRITDGRNHSLLDLALTEDEPQTPSPVEILFSRNRLDQMIRAGISPLAGEKGRDRAFLPAAVSVSGHSFAYQLLLSQVTRFVIWCRDNLPYEIEPDLLAAQLKMAFQVFSEQSRPPGLEAVEVHAHGWTPEKRPVRIVVVPSPTLLPNRDPIELALDW